MLFDKSGIMAKIQFVEMTVKSGTIAKTGNALCKIHV